MLSITRIAMYSLLATCGTASPLLPVPVDAESIPHAPRAVAAASSVAGLPAIPDKSTLIKGVQPEIVQAGTITKAQIAKVVLPKGGDPINKAATALSLARRQPATEEGSLLERGTAAPPAKVSSTQVFVNWDDLHVPSGGTLLSAMGPFTAIQVVVGPSNINGIAVTDTLGTTHTLGTVSRLMVHVKL